MYIVSKIIRFCSSPRLPALLLPVIMIYLLVGTIEQKYLGLYEATQIYFANPLLWAWDIIPLPGFPIWVGLLLIGLVLQIIVRGRWTKKTLGIMLTHIGVVFLLAGSLLTSLFSYEGYMPLLQEGEPSAYIYDYEQGQMRVMVDLVPARTLPFELRLKEFDKELHAGTNVASAYQSKIIVTDHENGNEWSSLIRMNEPLRYRGYTFYQSSYVFTPDGQVISILAVVRNSGRLFPYMACLIIALGLFFHLLWYRRPKRAEQGGRK